jgi:hypothetical protein
MKMEIATIVRRKIIIPVALLAVGLMVIYFVFNPETAGFFPPCLFHKLTGLKCPGCGTQRAIHSILHGEVAQAFFYNPALFAAVPLVGTLLYLESFGGRSKFPMLFYFLSGTKFITGLLVVIMLYWLGRNILF